MAISLADLLASGPYVFGHPNRVETITPIPEIIFDANFIANAHRQLDSLAEDTSPSTNSIQMTPSTSGSHARRRYNNYHCVVCSRPYDRAERARDCANRDKGLTPHTCGGQWGKTNCTKAYSSGALLRVHLIPPEDRDFQCPKWSVSLS